MRRIAAIFASALSLLLTFIASPSFAQESPGDSPQAAPMATDPVDVAVQIRRCLNGKAALEVPDGALAAVLNVDGYSFIVWPPEEFGVPGDRMYLNLPDQLWLDPRVVLELAEGDPTMARPTMARVAQCGRQAVPIFP